MVPTVMVLSVTPRAVAPCAVPGPHTPFSDPKSPAPAVVDVDGAGWELDPLLVDPLPDRLHALPATRVHATVTAAHASMARRRRAVASVPRMPASVSTFGNSRWCTMTQVTLPRAATPYGLFART